MAKSRAAARLPVYGLVAGVLLAQLALAPFAFACPMLWDGADAACPKCNPEATELPPCHRTAETESAPCPSGAGDAGCCQIGATTAAAVESATVKSPDRERTLVSLSNATLAELHSADALGSESDPPDCLEFSTAPPSSFQTTHLRL